MLRRQTPQVQLLATLLDGEALAIGDLTLTEILQGIDTDLEFAHAVRQFDAFPVIAIGGSIIATQAARNYRFLRARGITIRKTIDTLIATRCIEDGHALLYSDRDFDPFVEHLGLVSAMAE